MDDWSGVYVGSSDEFIQRIRDAINIPNTEIYELSDAVIQSAIDRATDYVSILAREHGAPSDVAELATLNYAIYLAYQSYSDRVRQTLPGSYTEGGKWSPIGEEILRSTSEKLRALREVADESISIIKSSLKIPYGVPTLNLATPAAVFRRGMHDNPPSDDLEA